MPLDKTTLQSQLQAIFEDLDPSKTPEQVAQEMADAIDVFVKSGTVNTAVTGSCPTGAVTGTGTGAVT